MKKSKRILIVGGVAGGASAAARARRLSEEAEIVLFERGEYISFANCGLPYHIGGTIKDREKLLIQTPEKMRARFNIDVRINSEVIKINREKRDITVVDRKSGKEYQEKYDTLILSPGASPVKPPIPGIENETIFTLRNINDMDNINNFINGREAKKAIVVGGGYIGLEMAENLRERNLDVTIVELLPQVMGPIDPEMATLLHQELTLNGVELKLGNSVTAFKTVGEKIVAELDSKEELAADLVILAIGVKPENNLAKEAGLKLGERGGIVVNEKMLTSDPDIYAIGDAVEITEFVSDTKAQIPLAGPANRQGRIAADNIFGRNSTYQNTQGTGICKLFNLSVAMTGLNEKLLTKLGIGYEKIYLHPMDHASYYPGATQISLKLLFNPESGKILGAQAVGPKGADKRIDLLALAMRAGLTVNELQDSELCYAPPFGSAKDPINHAAFVASNVINGDMQICHTIDVQNLTPNQLLIDVRTPLEFEAGTIPNSINTPIDDLRGRLETIPKEKEILVFCRVGIRGYLACRILKQHGYNCRNLTGGYTTYKMVTAKINTKTSANPEKTPMQPSTEIDARGLQCPGPIQKLKEALANIQDGEQLTIVTTDPGFVSDAPAWCNSTGHKFIETKPKNGAYHTTIEKNSLQPSEYSSKVKESGNKKLSIVLFSGDFDKAMAAFIIANGALTMGFEVTIFFTFWGLNVLRKDAKINVKKTLIEKMFGFMMPRGAKKLALSKMNMLGMGTGMIKSIMRKKNVLSLPQLIESAQAAKVKLVGCTMTMELMGIKPEELINGVDEGGVAMYLDKAGQGNINLFI